MTTCIFDSGLATATLPDFALSAGVGDCTPGTELARQWDRVPRILRVSIEDLVSVKNRLCNSLDTASWSRAASLAGPRIASIVKTLVTTADLDLAAAIFNGFCPPCLQPAEWTENPYRVFDLAIRTVHAHALLGRADVYLAYAQEISDLDAGGDAYREFEPNDLLAEMVCSRVADLQANAGHGRAHRRPYRRREETLFQLISNEAARRLGCDRPPVALSNRVKKHLPQFQDLVSLAQRR